MNKAKLTKEIEKYDRLLVAFSGGVDSTCLLAMAVEVLGREKVVALTAVSPTLPAREREETVDLAKTIGVRHLLLESGEMADPRFLQNDSSRCFFCKSSLFDLCETARADLPEPERWTIVYGANKDDLGDHRPGMQAARERGVPAPLLEAGLGKDEIRAISKAMRLPTWDKPAFACLSSRFPTGIPITPQALTRVERAEEILREAGFRQFRVRIAGDGARIEVDVEEKRRLDDPALRERLATGILEAGFERVEIDPRGYRQGGANQSS